MKKFKIFCFGVNLALILGCRIQPHVPSNVSGYVNPFICTEGDNGMLYPGPAMPFGMVHLSPETEGDSHVGYYYENQYIEGFSHTRIAGGGSQGKGGGLLIKPGIGVFTNKIAGFREKLIKSTEQAEPGYYSVRLESGIEVELTASNRTGMHRYTFPGEKRDNRYVVIDLSHSYVGMMDARLAVRSDRLITGFFKATHNRGGGYHKMYFAILSDLPFQNYTTWNGDSVMGQIAEQQGPQTGIWIQYSSSGPDVLNLKAGLSTVSEEQAVIEARDEVRGFDFDKTRKLCAEAWLNKLGRVKVESQYEELKTIFYTHLYHTYLVPHLSTASNGDYVPLNYPATIKNTAKTGSGFTYYSTWSLWDDFRKYALISLLEPSIAKNIAASLVENYSNFGMPGFDSNFSPTPHIRMEFSSAVVLDAWNKNLVIFDREVAYKGAKTMALKKSGVRNLSDEIEECYYSYSALKMAEALGKTVDTSLLRTGATAYKHLWCAGQKDREGNTRGFFTPMGKPVEDVEDFEKNVYEGHLWHYRWFVLHDVNGLISLRGSKEKLCEDLDYFFSKDLFMMVNEPDLHCPFLFNYLDAPWLTQKWARAFTTKVVTQRYHNHGLFSTPVVSRIFRADTKGYIESMDDDAGAMSSWFVMSAMGLFPADPAMPIYLIGSPVFEEYSIRHENGKTFTVKAAGVSEENFYIQSAKLNGVPFDQCWISYEDILNGGTLEFVMGPNPEKRWGLGGKPVPNGM